MTLKQWFVAVLILLATPATHAFDFSSIDLNKLGDIVSKSADAVGDIDEQKEIEIGAGVAARLLGAVPLVHNPAVQYYINDIGLWLAMQTERAELPWRFAIIDSDTINAFAAPGGFVFLTRGLFESLRDEAELAGVLAHEIGHVLKYHHLNAIQKTAQLGIAADVASMAVNQKGYNLDAFVNTGVELYAKGLDKDDEFEADEVGVVIATRGGYQPEGLLGVLMTLENLNPEDDSFALMFKTHPPASERLAKLQAMIGEKLENFQQAPRIEQRLAKMQQQLIHTFNPEAR